MNQEQAAVRQIIGTGEPAARRAVYQLELIGSGLRDLFRNLELIQLLAIRGFKLQYTQSVLGYGWAIFNPLFQMLIMSFVFSEVLRIPSQGVPFPLFLLVGLIAWNFFHNGVATAVDSVAYSIGIVTKVYFPREAILIAGVIVKLVDLLLAALVFVVVMLIYQWGISFSVLWVVAILAVQMLFTVGVGLPLAALNVYFRDTRYLVQVGLLAWMYLTPVFYPVDIVPDRYRWVFDINPMSVIINAYRQVILVGKAPDIAHLLLAAGVSLVFFVVGYWIFRLMGRGFADSV